MFTTDAIMRELPKVRPQCPDSCNARNPLDSYHYKAHAAKKCECMSDDESAHSSLKMDDDGSDSDSDWEEQQENLREKRSGGGGGTKRKSTFPGSTLLKRPLNPLANVPPSAQSPNVNTGGDGEIDTEDEYIQNDGDRIDTGCSPCY